MTVLSMSKQEFSRRDVLLRVQSGRLRVADACALMGLHRRQVFRLLRGLKQDGAASLLSKRRSKPRTERRHLGPKILRDLYRIARGIARLVSGVAICSVRALERGSFGRTFERSSIPATCSCSPGSSPKGRAATFRPSCR